MELFKIWSVKNNENFLGENLYYLLLYFIMVGLVGLKK